MEAGPMAKFQQTVIGSEHDFQGTARIDIAVSESGISSVMRKIEQAAAASQRLSPEAAMSLRGEALRLSIHLENIVKEAAKVALRTVVKATPHDTGLARGNYTVKINATKPGSYPTKDTDYEGDQTIEAGIMEIDAADRQAGQVYWISNSAHHITSLENGWSQQAPFGMTSIAKIAADNYVREAGATLKNKKV